MPRFVFTLQALLDQRLHAERQKQLALAAVERERGAIQDAIRTCQSQLAAYKEDLRARLGPGSFAAADLKGVRLQASESLHTQMRAQRLALQLAGLLKRIDAARAELREATTRRRAVELLKQRRYDAWKREIARREGIELDEIGTMRAARAMMEHEA